MHLVMFDIDGTLIESYDFDTVCFQSAIKNVLGISVGPDWSRYQHVTDSGILTEIIDGLGLQNEQERIFSAVKKQFLNELEKYVSSHNLYQIHAAFDFLSRLIKRQDIKIAFATGGWAESARIKLDAAGINLPDVALASSSDHFSRTEIMKLAEMRASQRGYNSKTYFGDGVWDQNAAKALGYNFICVGNRCHSPQSIDDYSDFDKVFKYIGL